MIEIFAYIGKEDCIVTNSFKLVPDMDKRLGGVVLIKTLDKDGFEKIVSSCDGFALTFEEFTIL